MVFYRLLIQIRISETSFGYRRAVTVNSTVYNSVSKFIVLDWGDEVNTDIGLSYRPARLHRLAGRYDNPMPESTIPPVRDYEFGYRSSGYLPGSKRPAGYPENLLARVPIPQALVSQVQQVLQA